MFNFDRARKRIKTAFHHERVTRSKRPGLTSHYGPGSLVTDLERWKASYEDYRSFIAVSSEGIWRFEFEQPIPVTLPVDDQIEQLYKVAYLAECNNAMARMYGYDSAEQILGARLGDIMPQSDPKNIEYLRALHASGYSLNDVESSELDRYGQPKVILNSLSAIVEDGMLVRAWGTQRDITAQKHGEEALRASEERYRLLTDLSPDGVVVTALDGTIHLVNPSALRMLGTSTEDIAGRSLFDFVAPEFQDRCSELMKTVMTAGADATQVEGTLRSRDGRSIPVEVGAVRFDGNRQFAQLVVHDLTGRKQAEAERERWSRQIESERERFAKAFQASPDGLVISRIADGVILEVNDSFLSMSGYARDELIGKSTLEIGIYADTSSRDRALKILKEQNFVRNFELPMRRKSGEMRWALFSAEPLDLRGEHCWLTIGRDITERKHAEEERERLLRQEKEAREEAETASRMKDEFLGTISHELRTPLTAILGWASMLNRGLLSEVQTRHALEVIERSAKSQAGLVDDILDTARIITGRLKLETHPVEIAQVFQAAVDVVRPSAEAKGIALHVVIDDRAALAIGDANRVQQVIWNLLSNAVKFTSEGGRVEATLSRTDRRIEITVTDTGIGIDPQFMPYIFDRFRQADSTSTRKYSGLGLGLAIVRHLVEMHGGTVAASSPGKGQGATFKVRFPIASRDTRQTENRQSGPELKQPAQPDRLAGKPDLDGVCVLVVEDDSDTLEMLKTIFENRGARVITASSADAALEALERALPDALVSDLAMPAQDGYELIRRIRQRGPKRGGDIPAVALTAYARVEDRERALTAGYQDYVPKPVDPDELITAVANLTNPSSSRFSRLIPH